MQNSILDTAFIPTKTVRSILTRSILVTALLWLSLAAFAFGQEAPEPVVVYMIGDSTMANRSLKSGDPARGWGQLLPEFVSEDVVVKNHASGGRSSRSFRQEGRWDTVLEKLKADDWVVIQFGHNDQKKKKPRLYTDPESSFREILTTYIEETRAKGAHPVLATSIYRRFFKQGDIPKDSLGGYPEATREVATSLKVPLVDLHAMTGKLLAESGPQNSKKLFLHFEPGEIDYFPKGKKDNSHLSEAGARAVAKLFANDIQRQAIGFPVRSP